MIVAALLEISSVKSGSSPSSSVVLALLVSSLGSAWELYTCAVDRFKHKLEYLKFSLCESAKTARQV